MVSLVQHEFHFYQHYPLVPMGDSTWFSPLLIRNNTFYRHFRDMQPSNLTATPNLNGRFVSCDKYCLNIAVQLLSRNLSGPVALTTVDKSGMATMKDKSCMATMKISPAAVVHHLLMRKEMPSGL
jgi:hypothetical protein